MQRIWKIDGGAPVELATSTPAREVDLENWIETNPTILDENLLIIGRQVHTGGSGTLDLLAVVASGDTVVIELKKAQTSRDTVAQALEYAAWISERTTKDIHDQAGDYFGGKAFSEAFREKFGRSLPEDLNVKHRILIVAAELDGRSRRIVEYLAEKHGLNINTFFFDFFIDGGNEYLAASWLMDQEDVEERVAQRTQMPWSGLWYVNVTNDSGRQWNDAMKYGFVSAGGGKRWSGPLAKLQVGDQIAAYCKGAGYVGYGQVTRTVVMARDFKVDGKLLPEVENKSPELMRFKDDPEKAEYVVGIQWKKTVAISNAEHFEGMFANQHIVCKLTNQATVDFLKARFGIEFMSSSKN